MRDCIIMFMVICLILAIVVVFSKDNKHDFEFCIGLLRFSIRRHDDKQAGEQKKNRVKNTKKEKNIENVVDATDEEGNVTVEKDIVSSQIVDD